MELRNGFILMRFKIFQLTAGTLTPDLTIEQKRFPMYPHLRGSGSEAIIGSLPHWINLSVISYCDCNAMSYYGTFKN